jgi:D-glucuronyl C5-epimerase C-terminus
MGLRPPAIAFAVLAAALLQAASAAGSPVLVFDGGRVERADDPALPPADASDPMPAAPRACSPAGHAAASAARAADPTAHAAAVSVRRALRRAYARGEIDFETYSVYAEIYSNAKRAWHRLGGRGRVELGSVIGTVNRFAASGVLTASRMAPVFLELERNTQWWSRTSAAPPPAPPPGGGKQRVPNPCASGAQIATGPRVQFRGDPLTLQYYPGAGLRLQPLANFGKANALYNACKGINTAPGVPCQPDQLRALLDRLVAMAANRHGFLAWEYYFPIYGGRPPWVSGIAEGSALSALAHGAALFQEQEQEQQQPPQPEPTPPSGGAAPPPPTAGAAQAETPPPPPNPPSFYLDVARRSLGIFQHAPPVGVRVSGRLGPHYLIYSFAPGERVGNAFLESLIGLYDYAQVSGDRGAQTLFAKGDREARYELRKLDTGAWSLYALHGPESDLNYHRVIRDFARGLCERTQISVYCDAAERFTSYLSQRPRVSIVGPKVARAGKYARIPIQVSKISCLTIAIFKGDKLIAAPSFYFPHGVHAFSWRFATPGAYRIKVLARDLLNHQTTVEASVRVLKRGRR